MEVDTAHTSPPKGAGAQSSSSTTPHSSQDMRRLVRGSRKSCHINIRDGAPRDVVPTHHRRYPMVREDDGYRPSTKHEESMELESQSPMYGKETSVKGPVKLDDRPRRRPVLTDVEALSEAVKNEVQRLEPQ